MAVRLRTHARRVRAAAARQLLARARPAGGDGRRASPTTRTRSRSRAGWPSGCASTSTSDLGYRYPGAEDRSADRKLAELCRVAARRPLRGPREPAPRPRRGSRRSCAIIRSLGLSGFFLLHRDLLELAREVAVEVRGPDSARALLPPGRGRGSSVVLDRLLPHRPLARRPGRERPVPRPLPQRGADRAAGHRPRLPARHPRGADPARARALRARPLGARGGVRRPTTSAVGVRDFGKALGLPPGEIERARAVGRAVGRGQRGATTWRTAIGAQRAASPRWRALTRLVHDAWGLPRHVSQHLGRDGDLDPAARRDLPDPAGGDGGAADGPVGQGLVRRRRLPEDRPARAGDAVGGRALRRRDRARARRADRPLADPVRRPARSTARSRRRRRWASSRSRAARRCRC